MNPVTDLEQYLKHRQKQALVKQYEMYYGKPVEVAQVVRRPHLVVVGPRKYTEEDVHAMQHNIDMDAYMEWLAQQEDIDVSEIEILQPNSSVDDSIVRKR